MIDLTDRHPGTQQIAQWFDYKHLPEGTPGRGPRHVSLMCAELASDLIETLPDGPELTAALRKLLEAKDCAVRAAVAAEADPADIR